MSIFKIIEEYGNAHHPKWMVVLRIFLGILLIGKGYMFMWNIVSLEQIIIDSGLHFTSFGLKYYIEFAHLFGGLFILFGFKTRIAILFQIPILTGAVFFVNASNGLFSSKSSELEFSILVLFLLIFFFIYGSGSISADAALRRSNQKETLA